MADPEFAGLKTPRTPDPPKADPLELEPHPFAESYGWRKPNPKARAYDPTKPLYVWKAPGGIWIGDEFVKRGDAVPAHLLRELGGERVKLMHWVRELDHVPVPGVEPAETPAPVPRRKAR